MPRGGLRELVFVVDISAFTKNGFASSTTFRDKPVDIEFDDGDLGVFLPRTMAEGLGVRKGSPLAVVLEDGSKNLVRTKVASVGKGLRISESRVYYAVGKAGSAVVRIRKP
ncbi:MAG: hypothetical protein HY297_05085 [Thaumarchaeota archaeon]|nr:hypothetical protein [Nitrososphaerota archaeon]